VCNHFTYPTVPAGAWDGTIMAEAKPDKSWLEIFDNSD
jgi:hypothetical protein